MTTLRVIVEGTAEETFVRQVLVPHLAGHGIFATPSRVVTKGGRGSTRDGQGGGSNYLTWRRDIKHWIRQEERRQDVWFTTMFDLYGLARVRGFPGYADASGVCDSRKKVERLEKALEEDIGFCRFIPYLQLHEFEALLLVDATVLKKMFIDRAEAIDDLVLEISRTGCSAEQINEGEETSPSKRIQRHLPSYQKQKAVAGPDALASIGLPRLLAACPHFAAWVERLETLSEK